MKRRDTLGAMLALLGAPLAGIAQPAGRTLRLGILDDASERAQQHLWRAFLKRLRELGYAEGKNLVVEARYAHGVTERLPVLAAELVRLKSDVIVTRGTPASHAAKQATAAVPIIFVGTRDPVSVGLVASLARPGGNATGLSALQEEVATKWIELLLELAPAAKRVAFLGDTTNKGVRMTLADLQSVAQPRKLAVVMLDARQRQDVDRAFVAFATERCEGLIVGISSTLLDHRDRILQFAARQKLPVVYARREYVDAGGLLSYGVDLGVMYLRAAEYVHRIAQGAKPAELPVERVNVVRLVVNMKTARALGINIPQRVLVRADEVIE